MLVNAGNPAYAIQHPCATEVEQRDHRRMCLDESGVPEVRTMSRQRDRGRGQRGWMAA
ncbi:hypothetical protein JOF53_000497 [Crossiella equi]|uniref:Uncharacterized protein n=1 Tax=Crossiella equi TaxID=130796 RepID=A0ABS5A7F0_9PSEU|nr:hypothetical protein [Crossiella equi]MBP2471625.1 hypothetical protein [Crossiella equi]